MPPGPLARCSTMSLSKPTLHLMLGAQAQAWRERTQPTGHDGDGGGFVLLVAGAAITTLCAAITKLNTSSLSITATEE